MVALIALTVRRVDRHIDGHAIAADQLLGKLAGDLRPILGADLGRQGQLPFAGGNGVATGLAGLCLVPELGAILRPGRGSLGGDDEGLLDALLAGVVVDATLALALNALARPVGTRCRCGAPGAAFDRLHGEVVAGHQHPTEQRRKRCQCFARLTSANAPSLAVRSAAFFSEVRWHSRGWRRKGSPFEGVQRTSENGACREQSTACPASWWAAGCGLFSAVCGQ